MSNFELLNNDHLARRGIVNTDHGIINTPAFMPVGTAATVKAVTTSDLLKTGSEILLGNTYHLMLRPGDDLISKFGGLHDFMNWHLPILTDSGGYQVFSLSKLRKLTDDGVEFKSHIDGSYHFFSPEKAIKIQKKIGADIIMAFDECTPYPCEYNYAKKSMNMTHRWLKRCIKEFNKYPSVYDYDQTLFPIVQGSTFKDLRAESADFIANIGAKGNAIGGLSVGEPADEMYEMTQVVCDILPEDKPRYLMGVGTPINLLENIALGVDMFDCVMPSRNARNGMLFTANGTINIKNEKWKDNFEVIDSDNYSFVDVNYSKAYLRHLFSTKEALGRQIATIHNLSFYLWLVKEARNKIIDGTFKDWKVGMVKRMNKRL